MQIQCTEHANTKKKPPKRPPSGDENKSQFESAMTNQPLLNTNNQHISFKIVAF